MSEIKKIKIGNETYDIGVDGISFINNGIQLDNCDGFLISDKNSTNYLSMKNSIAYFENANAQFRNDGFKLNNDAIRFTSHSNTITVTIDPEYGVVKFANGYELRGTTTQYFADYGDYLLSDKPIVVNYSSNGSYVKAHTLCVTRIQSPLLNGNVIEISMDYLNGIMFRNINNGAQFFMQFTTSSTTSSSSSSTTITTMPPSTTLPPTTTTQTAT